MTRLLVTYMLRNANRLTFSLSLFVAGGEWCFTRHSPQKEKCQVIGVSQYSIADRHYASLHSGFYWIAAK